MHLGIGDSFSVHDSNLTNIPLAGELNLPESGYARLFSSQNNDIVLLESVRTTINSWPAFDKVIKCWTLLSNYNASLNTLLKLPPVHQDWLELLPQCPTTPGRLGRPLPSLENV